MSLKMCTEMRNIMKIEHLRYLITLEQTNSLNKAADKLFISQPNLSNAINSLENELGYKILKRSNRGIEFTPTGKKLLIYAHNILSEYHKILNLDEIPDNRIFKIAASASQLFNLPFYNLVTEYQNSNKLDMSLHNSDQWNILRQVYDGEVNAGFLLSSVEQETKINTYIQEHKLYRKIIKEVECNYNLRSGHPIFEDGFSIEKLWNYPFVEYFNRDTDSYSGIDINKISNPSLRITVSDREARCRIVSMTNAFSIGTPLPQQEQKQLNLICIPIPDMRMKISMITKKNINGSKASCSTLLNRYLELLNQFI